MASFAELSDDIAVLVKEEVVADVHDTVTAATRKIEGSRDASARVMRRETHNGVEFTVVAKAYTLNESSAAPRAVDAPQLVAEVNVVSDGSQFLTSDIVQACKVRMEAGGWVSFVLNNEGVMQCRRPLKRYAK